MPRGSRLRPGPLGGQGALPHPPQLLFNASRFRKPAWSPWLGQPTSGKLRLPRWAWRSAGRLGCRALLCGGTGLVLQGVEWLPRLPAVTTHTVPWGTIAHLRARCGSGPATRPRHLYGGGVVHAASVPCWPRAGQPARAGPRPVRAAQAQLGGRAARSQQALQAPQWGPGLHS